MKIRPYREGDLESITRRSRDDFGPDDFENTKEMCERDITFTFEIDGVPVAVCGCTMIQKGVKRFTPTGTAQCWTVISDQVRGHGVELTKKIRHMIDDYCKAHDVGRMQTYIRPSISENARWIELLGFRFESTLFRAGPDGNDLAMYVRFYE